MKPVPFDYAAPDTLEAATALLAAHGEDARPLAGGQSLVPMLALRLIRPSVVVDLNRISALAHISREGDDIVIGTMTRQADILKSELIRGALPILAEALAEVGHPPTRARGTIGGSLSHADPAAEMPAVMMALDARMVIVGVRGERSVGAAEFFHGPFQTAVEIGELLTGIRIPIPPRGGMAFLELARRRGDFAILEAVARVELDADGLCSVCRVVVGAVGPKPMRCGGVEAMLIGRRPCRSLIADVARAIAFDDFDMHSHHASLDYRIRVAPVVVRRALETAATRAGASVQ